MWTGINLSKAVLNSISKWSNLPEEYPSTDKYSRKGLSILWKNWKAQIFLKTILKKFEFDLEGKIKLVGSVEDLKAESDANFKEYVSVN